MSTAAVPKTKAVSADGEAPASSATPASPPRPITAASPKASLSRFTGKGKEAEVAHGPVRWKGTSRTSPEACTSVTLPEDTVLPVTSPARSNRSLSPATSPRAIRSRPHDNDESHQDGSLGLYTIGSSAGPSRSPERPRVVRPPGGRPAGKAKGDAVSIYARAVEAEQAGQLNDALNLYRQAFKMDGVHSTCVCTCADSRQRGQAIRTPSLQDQARTDHAHVHGPRLRGPTDQRSVHLSADDPDGTGLRPPPRPL